MVKHFELETSEPTKTTHIKLLLIKSWFKFSFTCQECDISKAYCTPVLRASCVFGISCATMRLKGLSYFYKQTQGLTGLLGEKYSFCPVLPSVSPCVTKDCACNSSCIFSGNSLKVLMPITLLIFTYLNDSLIGQFAHTKICICSKPTF